MNALIFRNDAVKYVLTSNDGVYFVTTDAKDVPTQFLSAKNLNQGYWLGLDSTILINGGSDDATWLIPDNLAYLYLTEDGRKLLKSPPDELLLCNWAPETYTMTQWAASQRRDEKILLPATSYEYYVSDSELTVLAKRIMGIPLLVTPESHHETSKLINGLKKSINSNTVTHQQLTKLARLHGFRIDSIVVDLASKKELYRGMMHPKGPVIIANDKLEKELINAVDIPDKVIADIPESPIKIGAVTGGAPTPKVRV